jgi:hypothetical protein
MKTKRKQGDVVHCNAIADRGGHLIATLDRDQASLKLLTYYHATRRNAKGICVSRGGQYASVWDCVVVGGKLDGTFCELAFYEPASDL